MDFNNFKKQKNLKFNQKWNKNINNKIKL
jgi:hypothetical protein